MDLFGGILLPTGAVFQSAKACVIASAAQAFHSCFLRNHILYLLNLSGGLVLSAKPKLELDIRSLHLNPCFWGLWMGVATTQLRIGGNQVRLGGSWAPRGDVNDAKELQEIYTLLTENYVEDDDAWWCNRRKVIQSKDKGAFRFHCVWKEKVLASLFTPLGSPHVINITCYSLYSYVGTRTACSASIIQRTSCNGP